MTRLDELIIEDVFAIYETNDERGSRGSLVMVTGALTAATAAAKGVGWFGGTGEIVACRAILIENKMILLDQKHPHPIDPGVNLIKRAADIRKAAIAKLNAALTPNEITLLGLNNLK